VTPALDSVARYRLLHVEAKSGPKSLCRLHNLPAFVEALATLRLATAICLGVIVVLTENPSLSLAETARSLLIRLLHGGTRQFKAGCIQILNRLA